MLGLEQGERIKLTTFVAKNKANLLQTYRNLTFAEKNAYNARVLEARQQKTRTVRANPKAIRHDMNAAFASMDREVGRGNLIIYSCTHRYLTVYMKWMALCARTGMQGFYVAVRGGIEDLAEPKMFFTEKAQKFVSNVLGVEPQHLGLKLEAFVVSKLGMYLCHCYILSAGH